MAEAKTGAETVVVHLDRVRPYRLRDEDREAVWVGPGAVEVPRWVAVAWGLVADGATPGQEADGVTPSVGDGFVADEQPPDAPQTTQPVQSLVERGQSPISVPAVDAPATEAQIAEAQPEPKPAPRPRRRKAKP